MNTFGCLTYLEHRFIRIHKGIGHNFQTTDLCLSVTGNTDKKENKKKIKIKAFTSFLQNQRHILSQVLGNLKFQQD